MNKITILLADDHAIVRRGIAALIESEPDMEIVAQAKDGEEAIALTEQTRPNVVVMDIAMPVMNGLEATKRIVNRFPETRVVVLSTYNDSESISKVTDSGAFGFVPKVSASSELVGSIREASHLAAV